MTADKIEHGPCPLQWGDRIDHKIFGFGTVVGEPVATVGGSMSPPYVVPRGWRITVEWDNPDRAQSDMGFDPGRTDVIRKVSSPNAKGAAYWQNEWRKLVQPLLSARAAMESYINSSFRGNPPFDPQRLAELQLAETQALLSLEDFLAAEERGEHE